MASMVIVATLLERLQVLFPEGNPNRKLIAKVIPVHDRLKQIMTNAGEDYKIADEIAQRFDGTIMRHSYDFEDKIESYVLEVTSRRNRFLQRISRRSSHQKKVIKQSCEELASKMVILAREHLDISRTQGYPVSSMRRSLTTTSIESAETVVGMQQDEKMVARELFGGSPQLTLILICGMSGIGKTTLARKLCQGPDTARHFHVRAWACLSRSYQTRNILVEILFQISNTWDRSGDMGEEDLAMLTNKRLKGQRYLIVLDDVWDANAWLSIRMAFPNDENGSRILITTRKNLVYKIGAPNAYVHQMGLSNEQESLKLLRQAAQLDGAEVDPRIVEIAEKIVGLSRGLPLAIVVLGRILVGKPLEEWYMLYDQLLSSDQGQSSNDSLFDLSYKHLALRLRPCFLYLGNFPEGSGIELDTLCQLWIAEGLISMEDVRNGETMIDVAERYLDELVQRSLVIIMANEEVHGQRMFRSTYMIDELLRDFCREKSKEDGIFEVIDWRVETQASDEVSHIVESGNENQVMSPAFRRAIYLPKDDCTSAHLCGKAEYMRSLLFFNCDCTMPQEIPDLDNFIMLRVLHLYGVYFKDGKLPKGVEKLVYLRYLGFRECYLTELSSHVRNMLYLQTLDLRVRNECEMIIPADVLDNLERLKYLYLPLACRTSNNQKLRLSRLKELEILDNFDTSLCNAVDLLGLTNLKELKVTTEGGVEEIEIILNFLNINSSNWRSTSLNIRNFDCRSNKRFFAVEKVFKSSALHALEIEGSFGKFPEFERPSSKLTEIVLNGSELDKDPMQILQDLTNLRILILEIEAYKGERMKCSSNGFLELRYLKLSKLYNLQKWEVESGAMPKLCTLIIENCKKLHMLPNLQGSSTLQTLEIASMPDEFVGRIQKSDGTAGEDFDKIRHVQPNIKVDGRIVILK